MLISRSPTGTSAGPALNGKCLCVGLGLMEGCERMIARRQAMKGTLMRIVYFQQGDQEPAYGILESEFADYPNRRGYLR